MKINDVKLETSHINGLVKMPNVNVASTGVLSRFAVQIDDRLEAATNLPGSEVCLNHSRHPMDDYQKHCSKKH